jgi:hypothetical protein
MVAGCTSCLKVTLMGCTRIGSLVTSTVGAGVTGGSSVGGGERLVVLAGIGDASHTGSLLLDGAADGSLRMIRGRFASGSQLALSSCCTSDIFMSCTSPASGLDGNDAFG